MKPPVGGHNPKVEDPQITVLYVEKDCDQLDVTGCCVTCELNAVAWCQCAVGINSEASFVESLVLGVEVLVFSFPI